MTNVLEQLNFIKYTKEDFLKVKSTSTLVLSKQLEVVLTDIENNIKKSGGSNSPFQNTNGHKKGHFNYKSHKYSKGNSHSSSSTGSSCGPSNKSNYGNGTTAKSWRITKTRIIKADISELDKHKHEINALLNKLSPKNFTNITNKIIKYYISEDSKINNELVDSTINNIFLKAVIQPVYCPYYVKFLNMINKEYNKIELINQKCIEYKSIIKPKIEDSEKMELNDKEKYDLFCKANKEKKYKEGYSQFIGELFNNKMISKDTLDQNIDFFVKNLEESSLEDAKSNYVEDLLICICKLFDTVTNTKEKNVIKEYCGRVLNIKQHKELPKRLKFKIMDLGDLMKKRNIIIV